MTFIPTPNAVRATMQGIVQSNEANYTLWFLGAAPATLASLGDLGDALQDWWQSSMQALLSTDYTLASVYLLAQDSNTAPFLTQTLTTDNAGTVASGVIIPQTAPVIKFSTANRGRSGRGRNYVPGAPISMLATPGVLSTTARGNLLAAYAFLPTATGPAGFTHVVVSHQHDGVPLTSGLAQTVTGYAMTSLSVGTVRKRRIGVGA